VIASKVPELLSYGRCTPTCPQLAVQCADERMITQAYVKGAKTDVKPGISRCEQNVQRHCPGTVALLFLVSQDRCPQYAELPRIV
jgi:hypothetical protein